MKSTKFRIQAMIIIVFMFVNLIPFHAQASVQPMSPTASIDYTTAISSSRFDLYYNYLRYKINCQYDINSTLTAEQLKTKLSDINFKQDLAHLEFISRYGADMLNSFANTDAKKAFLMWLFQNVNVMNTFLDGGEPRNSKYLKAMSIFEELWRSDPESHSGIYLTLAMATALDHADSVDTGWYQVDASGKATIIDPISRYNNYKTAHKAKKLYPVFDTLDVWHMRLVVDAWLTDADLDWARTTYAGPHSIVSEKGVTRNFTKVYNRSNITDAGHELEYNSYNAAGISVQNGALSYYGSNATLQTVLKVGGVCGAIAKYGTSIAQAYGVPAMPIGQPGHAAAIYNKEDGVWALHNDISGFGESFLHGGTIVPWSATVASLYVDDDGRASTANFGPAYMLLFEDADKEPSNVAQSELLRLLAKELVTPEIGQAIRSKAMEICPKNIQIWREYIAELKKDSNTPASKWNTLNSNIISAFANHPRPMTELLTSIQDMVLAGASEETKSNYVISVFNAYEAVTDAEQVQIRDIVEKSMPSWMFDYIPKPIINFSFSGENADKLMGFKKGMSFSIDGGKTFVSPADTDYKLSIPEINALTVENKIWVKNKYSTATTQDKMTIINIMPNTSGSINVSGDDTKNTISGIDNSMEFSVNRGITWSKYDGSNIPDLTKNVTLLVRRPGNGLMMSSKTVELTYTALVDLAFKKTAKASSSYSGDSSASAFDGNAGSSWLGGGGNLQWIYVDLGKTYYVNGVKLNWGTPVYWKSHGKKYKIQVSNKDTVTEDPNDWTDVYSTENGDGGIDMISFDGAPARYVRMYATEVAGGYSYASVHDFEVYDGSIIPTEGKKNGVTYLSDMAWSSCSNGWGPAGLDMSINGSYYKTGQRIALDGKQYLKGLGLHANSQIQYNLDGKYTTFSSDIGIDDEVGDSASVTYEVIKDSTTVYKSSSNVTKSSPVEHLNIDVTGAKTLTLKISDGGNGNGSDHADWADAYLISKYQNEDVNQDGKIDIRDLAIVATSYNKTLKEKDWNTKLDIFKDEVIDIFDLVAIAKKIK